MIDTSPDPVDFDFPIISENSEKMLEDFHGRARQNYKSFKQEFLEWLYHEGKKPEMAEGYADKTLRQTHYKTEMIYQWLWKTTGGYTITLEPDDADELMKHLGRHTDRSKTDLLNFTKAIKRIFRYYNYQKGHDYEWEKPFSLSEPDVTNRDYFKQSEFNALYEASLNHGAVKSYNNCTPEERDNIRAHLAQRFEKPKTEIGRSDWERANTFKIPSLVSASLDCGLRPIEVKRAKADWVNLKDARLEIPHDQSSKNKENWAPSLSDKSVRALELWLDERAQYKKYDGRDELWLNNSGNPYNSKSLNYLLRKLLDETEIEPAGRELSWYSIRHGVATLWATNESISKAKPQLRHTHTDTTLGYAQTDSDDRNEAANSKW